MAWPDDLNFSNSNPISQGFDFNVPTPSPNAGFDFGFTSGNQMNTNVNNTLNANNSGGFNFDFLNRDSAFGQGGWFAPAVQGVSALSNLYFGNQQLGLARDTFNFNKGIQETNLANQAQLANQSTRDTYLARLGARGITGEAAEQLATQYMDKNSVSDKVGG